MADIREKLGRATQTSDMGDREGVAESDRDRIVALAIAGTQSPLGAAVARWIGGAQDRAYLSVVDLLVGALHERFGKLDGHLTICLALEACREFGEWACVECGGRGDLKSGTGLTFTCPRCNGSKLRAYTDLERADAMGLSLADYRANQVRLSWALECLRRHDHEARRIAAEQLSTTY